MNDQRIAVITDSGTDTPSEFCREHDVRVMPLHINYADGTTFQSGVDITADEVTRRLATEIPKTSLPSPHQIQTTLEQARADGYQRAVVVTIASALSATNQTAHMVAGQMEDFPTIVVDTRSIGMVAGMVVERAVQMVEAGVPFEQLQSRLDSVAQQSNVFFAVKSLDFLYKGGRINGHIYRIGSVLNIKPVLTCDDEGYYTIAKKARGWDRALDTMVSLVADRARQYKRARLAVCCSSTTRDLYDALEQKLRAAVPNAESVQRHDLSADLLVHTGPEMAGMGVQNAELDF